MANEQPINEFEAKEFDAKYMAGAVAVDGWRRKPDQSKWRISIQFGDDGDGDPGIYMEKDKDRVLAILADHKRQIDEAIQYIKDNFND